MAAVALPDRLDAAQQAVAEEVRAARGGRLPDLYRMLLHSPGVASGWLHLGTAVRFGTALPEDVRELLICYVAEVQGCPPEVATHTPLAAAAGVPHEALADLRGWRTCQALDEGQRAALALADRALGRDAGGASDGAGGAGDLDEVVMVEIFALVAYYTAIAMFMAATGLTGA